MKRVLIVLLALLLSSTLLFAAGEKEAAEAGAEKNVKLVYS
jgi:ABC-type oligopeptide transport system substrate-binding subunit